jgi:hypothetical protein
LTIEEKLNVSGNERLCMVSDPSPDAKEAVELKFQGLSKSLKK